MDLMIAATALAHELPLSPSNPKDLRGLERLMKIVDAADPAAPSGSVIHRYRIAANHG